MSTMKNLVIRPADVSLNPLGEGSNVADARVSVVYDRDVWVGGQPVPRVPLISTSIPTAGLRVPVLASDDPTITEGAGFVIKVIVETSPRIGQHNDTGTSLARTIQVVTADPAEIPLGSKSSLTQVADPAQYADVMSAIKAAAAAKTSAAQAKATADAMAADVAASKTAATQAATSATTAQQSAASSAASAQAAQSALLTPSALPVSFPNLITDPTYTVFGANGWSFLGGITGDHPLMTPDQVRKLWDTYGWEIGAHTHAHEDAVDTAIDKWRTSAEASITNIIGMGLPRPTSFAYPNGSRNAATDKLTYGLFDKVGLTGGPERMPWPYNKGTFFTGWCALGGATDADGKAALAKVKQYIRASFDQGNIPIVGMHGVTLAQPTLGHFVRADLLADLCQWLWAEGYPVSTQKDTPTHNMIADPGFMDQALTTSALGGHPWSTASVNGWKQYSDPAALAGKCARLAATSGIGSGSQTYVEQRIAVHPGSSYKVYLHHCSPAYTSGAVVARVLWYDILGTQIGTDTPTAATINRAAPTGGEWVGGAPITAPAGACVARLQLLPDQAAGVTGDIRVDSVAMFPTTTYDPLA